MTLQRIKIIRDGFRWTDEKVERLRYLHAQGLSFSQIATEIGGISRNACIGKAKRICLGARVTNPPKRRHYRPTGHSLHRIRAAMRAVEKACEEVQDLAEVAANPVHLLDLKAHHCRYPFGEPADMMFCGATAVRDYSWCAHHYRIVFDQTRTRASSGKYQATRKAAA